VLLKENTISKRDHDTVVRHTQTASVDSAGAFALFVDLADIAACRTPVDILAYQPDASKIPLIALLIIMKAVESDDIGLFSETVERHLEILGSCKAMCLYLHRVTRTAFRSGLGAMRFRDLAMRVQHCRIRWPREHIEDLDTEALHAPFEVYDSTWGFETLAKQGSSILERKYAYEKNLIDLNKSMGMKLPKLGPILFVLRRYNSFSPILNYGSAYGGGYFLWTGTEGIVIDPGFDFIKNFISAGLPIQLIDKIIVTHAHPDHLADLPSLLTLVYEHSEYASSHDAADSCSMMSQGIHGSRGAHNRKHKSKSVDLYVSLSTYGYLNGILGLVLRSRSQKIHILERGQDYQLTRKITLTALPTVHTDCLAQDYGVGLLMKHSHKQCAFLYTSDTSINDDILTAYSKSLTEKCVKRHIMLCNMGGVHERELDALLFSHVFLSKGYRLPPPRYRYPNHLGILGLASIVGCTRPRAVLIGELGGEMHERRQSLADNLTVELGLPCLIADLGLVLEPFGERCFAIAQNRPKLNALKSTVGVERDGNMIYVYRDPVDLQSVHDGVQYSGPDAWHKNLPI
jgi:hypothetical protein